MRASARLLVLLTLAVIEPSCREKYAQGRCRSCDADDEAGYRYSPRTPGVPLVLVIANTTFEAEGLMRALKDSGARPEALPEPNPTISVTDNKRGLQARYECQLMTIEVLCVHEAVKANDKDKPPDLTENKVPLLREMVQGAKGHPTPALVIAFGTAAFPDEQVSHNGSVYLGSSIYIHSSNTPPEKDPVQELLKQTGFRYDSLIRSLGGNRFLRRFLTLDRTGVERVKDAVEHGGTLSNGDRHRFIDHEFSDKLGKPLTAENMINAVQHLEFNVEADQLGGVSVNVKTSAQYKEVDTETKKGAERVLGSGRMVSVETTHGLIRLACPSDSAFIFISGITNRLGKFPDEVEAAPKVNGVHAQDYTVSENAGRVAAYLLKNILEWPGVLQ
jgi:hypothetical protein